VEISSAIGLWRCYDRVVKFARLSAVNASLEQITEIFRLNLCSFQLRYTNYQFSASRHHLDFKTALKDQNGIEQDYLSKLDKFMLRGLSSLFGDVADDIQKYFCHTISTTLSLV
jgi:hypothetical protein